MSMAQLLGVWNSMPKTQAAELSTQNLMGASNSYANMDKQIKQTQTTTTKQNSSFLGDIMPVVGGIAGSIIGGPLGGMIGSGLGGALGSAVGGQNAASLGGMGITGISGVAGTMNLKSPWSWQQLAGKSK